MEDWQKRVVEEQTDLADKLDKLVAFTTGPAFEKLDSGMQDLMVQQASFMNGYNEVLKIRISTFPAEPAATGRKI